MELTTLSGPLEKYLVLQLKLFNDLLDTHPYSFVPLMRTCLTFVASTCFTDEGERLLFTRFTIFALNLLKLVLLCAEYKPSKNGDGKDSL